MGSTVQIWVRASQDSFGTMLKYYLWLQNLIRDFFWLHELIVTKNSSSSFMSIKQSILNIESDSGYLVRAGY